MPSTPSIQSNFVFEKTILNQYTTKYFVCPNCQHCQTEHPHWLDEAYQNAITNLDLGLVNRNEKLIVFLEKLFNIYFPKDIKILDYGSGYGLLLRMLRDRGFDCWGYDSYCESIFDKEHQIKDLDSTTSYDVMTAFELFEHVYDIHEIIKNFSTKSDNLIFSTKIAPTAIKDLENWWYLIPSTGQHVNFYSKQSLTHLAKQYNYHYIRISNDYHWFSKTHQSKTLFKITKLKVIGEMIYKILYKKNRETFLYQDLKEKKERLNLN